MLIVFWDAVLGSDVCVCVCGFVSMNGVNHIHKSVQSIFYSRPYSKYGGNLVQIILNYEYWISAGGGAHDAVWTSSASHETDLKWLHNSPAREETPFIFVRKVEIGLFPLFIALHWHKDKFNSASSPLRSTPSGRVHAKFDWIRCSNVLHVCSYALFVCVCVRVLSNGLDLFYRFQFTTFRWLGQSAW